MKAFEILSIPLTRPDKLFIKLDTIEDTYKTLAKTWHPDVSKDPMASDVLAHINVLYDLAKKAAANGSWGFTNTLIIKTKTGEHTYSYIFAAATELGEIYVTETSVIYAVKKECEKYYKQFVATTKFKFAGSKMKEGIEKTIPQDVRVVEDDERFYIRLNRGKNFIRLIDILRKGPIDQKHVAWMISRMYNVACYLSYANILHLDLSLESMFIDPVTHDGALLGGWFYAGNPPIAAPSRVINTLSNIKSTPIQTLHSQQIKLVGRKLLGANSVMQLKLNTNLPKPIVHWFMQGPTEDPVKEYADWKETLKEAYGPPKFIEYKFDINDVYN